MKVFDFLRLNVMGRITANNVPQFEVGCPPSPHIHETECKDSTSLSHHFFQHGYVTGKSATLTVRVNHYKYVPEDNIDRHEDHTFYVQCKFVSLHFLISIANNFEKVRGVIQHWNSVLNGEPQNITWSPFSPNLKRHCLFGNFPATYFLHNMEQLLNKYPEDVPK